MAALGVPEDAPRLVARGTLVVVGALLVLASGYAVVTLAPADLDPQPGSGQAVSEQVSYWTPEDGHEQVIRPRSDRVQQTGEGLELVRRIGGPHSPRGDEFRVDLADGWRLADEPAAHAAFPPTPPWQEPPEIVYVGVPWQTVRGDEVAGFDDFHRLHEVTRDGLTLVEYKAREPNQFVVDGDVVWFRSAERTALVEPVSGTVVDYRDEETVWRASLDGPELLRDVRPPGDEREKVWEATVEPTPAGQQRLAEQAEAARADHLRDLAVYGLPALVVAEGLMWAGIAGRPERWLAASA